MRIWLHSSAKSSASGFGTAISVVTHVVLVGLAVHGTGVSARELKEDISQHITRYLPPPDRVAASENLVEHLLYAEFGRMAPVVGQARPDVGALAQEAPPAPQPAGNAGNEQHAQPSSVEVVSQDSVYSVVDVEEQAVRATGSAAPIYPPQLIKERKEGGVFVRFVVDTTGRADSTTLDIVRATDPAFAQSVRHALPLMLFTPATIGGRRVRQAVEQSFQFKIAPTVPPESANGKLVP